LFLNSALMTARLGTMSERDAAFHADWVFSQVVLFGVCLVVFVFSVVRFVKRLR
jgi:hypothetical protein